MLRFPLLVALVAILPWALAAPESRRYILEFTHDTSSTLFDRHIRSRRGVTVRRTFDYQLFHGVSIEVDDSAHTEEFVRALASLQGVTASPSRMYSLPPATVVWTGRTQSQLRKRAGDDEIVLSEEEKKIIVEAQEGEEDPSNIIVEHQDDNNNNKDDKTQDNKTSKQEEAKISPHTMIQVDKLHQAGISGKGIKIAVIDSGVDYTHPALGGCFGPGCLVSFGEDLVGDKYLGTGTNIFPDKDPMDCNGHGTHVAGIIAAQENDFGFRGAAPNVTLGMYKVFGCEGGVDTEVLMDAFNKAFESGAQIITASIGLPSGWAQDPIAAMIGRMVDRGVMCTVPIGNDGTKGMFNVNRLATSPSVVSVGSVDNVMTPHLYTESEYTITTPRRSSARRGLVETGKDYTGNQDDQKFTDADKDADDKEYNDKKDKDSSTSEEDAEATKFYWTPAVPDDAWNMVTLPVYLTSNDTKVQADNCNEMPEKTPDLSKHIVVIRRGTCTFVQKAKNAAAKGARYIIITNQDDQPLTTFDVSEVEGIRGAGMVPSDVGDAWVKASSAGKTVTLSMSDPYRSVPVLHYELNRESGGRMSNFSSWGPTWDLVPQPFLAVPGGNILSTYPLEKGAYAVQSGTSMATPMTAAVFALLMEVYNSTNVVFLATVLANTAKPIDAASFLGGAAAPTDAAAKKDGRSLKADGTYVGNGIGAPIIQQGAGLIQAYDAAVTRASVSSPFLAFGDSTNTNRVFDFNLTNAFDHNITYEIAADQTSTVYFKKDGNDTRGMAFPNAIAADAFPSFAIEIDGEPVQKVTVPANDRVLATLRVIPPDEFKPGSLDVSRIASWGGYVRFLPKGELTDEEKQRDGHYQVQPLHLPFHGVSGDMNKLDPLAEAYLGTSDFAGAFQIEQPKEDDGTTPPSPPTDATIGRFKPLTRAKAGAKFVIPMKNETLVDENIVSFTGQLPFAYLDLGTGTPQLNVTIVEAKESPDDKPITSSGMDPKQKYYKPVGLLPLYPQTWLPTGQNIALITGLLADGTYLEAGQYRIQYRAQRIFGAPGEDLGTQTVTSDIFTLEYEMM